MIIDEMKALADGNRLRIIHALSQYDELCACQVIELLQVTGATVSRHIKILIDAGLVISRKDGKWVYYRLAGVANGSVLEVVIRRLEAECRDCDDKERLAEIVSCDRNELCGRIKG